MELFQRHAAALGHGDVARLGFAVNHDLLGLGGVRHHLEHVADFGQRIETQHLDGHGRLGVAHRPAAIVEHGADFAEDGAADKVIADVQRAVANQHGGHRAAAAIEIGFEHVADGGTVRVGLQIQHVGHQQDHFEQKIEVGLGPGGNRHHDHVAAPIFGQQTAIGQLLLDAFGLRVGLVHFVDGDDDGRAGRSGVIDGLDGLRHDAVVGRHHQDDDIGDFGAAGAHAGERFMAGRIDEYDLAAVLLDVISTDVLRDAAGLAVGDVGRTDRVQQRSFAVIDVAHDGDHGSAPHLIGGYFGFGDLLRALFFVADLVGGSAELARQVLGHLYVEILVDGGEDLLFHQLLDHQVGFDAELFGKLFDGDALGDGDLAIDGWRRRRLLAAARRHPQPALFLLHIAMAIASGRFGLVTPLLLSGGNRRGWFGAQRRRGMQAYAAGEMPRVPLGLWRTGRAAAHAGSAHNGLAGTNGATIDGLAGHGRGTAGGHSGPGCLLAEPAQEPDGSAVAAGAPPCRGAEARRDARPAVQRDSGAAADAEVFLELATPSGADDSLGGGGGGGYGPAAELEA